MKTVEKRKLLRYRIDAIRNATNSVLHNVRNLALSNCQILSVR